MAANETGHPAHRGLAATSIVIAVFGVAASVTLLRGDSFSGFGAAIQAASAAIMLVATLLLLAAGLLLLMGCARSCLFGSGACLGALVCLAISLTLAYGGTGPWLALMLCLMAALSLLMAFVTSRDLGGANRPA